MSAFEQAFFWLATLFVLVGAITTVAARNPIRGAMGLLGSIVGISGMYLLLSAEFLAAIQILVYAGAVVVLFLFVIMLLGPSATSARDSRTAFPRIIGAGLFAASAVFALLELGRAAQGQVTKLPSAPAGLGTLEGIGRELFTSAVIPFELSGALLLVAIVAAIAVARGKHVDHTLEAAPEKASKHNAVAAKEAA